MAITTLDLLLSAKESFYPTEFPCRVICRETHDVWMEPTEMNDLGARAPRQTVDLPNAFVILRPTSLQTHEHEKADYQTGD